MTTGERIKAARKKIHMTQIALGRKLGVSGSMIAQYETGTRNPKRETLEKIADALGVYYLDLYGDEESKEIAAFIQSGMRMGLNAQTALQRSEFLSEYMAQGYEFSPEETRLVSAYNKLNDNGQVQLLALAEGMAEIPRFMLEPLDEE